MKTKELVERKKLNKHPENTFDEVYGFLDKLENKKSPALHTTGTPGVLFTMQAGTNRKDGRKYLLAVSGNKNQSKSYIYLNDWGYKLNKSGTRIAHYAVPTDIWITKEKNQY